MNAAFGQHTCIFMLTISSVSGKFKTVCLVKFRGDDYVENSVGDLIKSRREAMGMSLKKLGEACDVSDSEILKIENGKRKCPNWSTLCRIAKVLNFHPFELLLKAGYISEYDVNPALRLTGLEHLSVEDLEVVQNVIDAQVAKNAKKLLKTTEFHMGELFCGPGGLAWGATHAVIENPNYRIIHKWANDFDENTCKTYIRNICPDDPGSVYCEDVHTLDISKLGKIDAFSFGFPCNDFSVVGEQKGFSGTYGPLYTYGIKVLRMYQPLWFLAENVGGLSSANEGDALEKIKADMKSCGYQIYPNLYKFEEYGIPQSRHRIIIVGIRNDLPLEFKIPSPEPYSDVDNTCRTAIEVPPIPADAPNNERTKQSDTVIRRLSYIKPGENAFTAKLPDDLRLNIKGAKISQIYKRLDPNKPSYTVTGSGGGGTHIYHWSEPRALTNRERARLQTFPDDFIFEGNKESVRKQIGMAVPCKGAKIIYEAILKTFARIPYDYVEPNMNDNF
jgi:DNA (cytosine-5)-methyltransferase 1